MRQFYYKMWQLLKNATILLQNAQLLQNATFIIKCDSTYIQVTKQHLTLFFVTEHFFKNTKTEIPPKKKNRSAHFMPILHINPLKTGENLWFSDVFRGYRNGILPWNGLRKCWDWNHTKHKIVRMSIMLILKNIFSEGQPKFQSCNSQIFFTNTTIIIVIFFYMVQRVWEFKYIILRTTLNMA